MNIVPVPGNAKASMPWGVVRTFGPPQEGGPKNCGSAEVLSEQLDGYTTPPVHHGYFKPSEHDLAVLNAGGYVDVQQWGDVLQPFGCGVFPSTPSEATTGDNDE